MSYVEQSRRRNPVAVAAAVGAHLVIGYALLSGLAYRVIKLPPKITQVVFPVDQPPPPPPPPHNKVEPKVRTATQPQKIPPVRPTEDYKLPPTLPVISTADFGSPPTGGGGTELPPPPARTNLARDAIPGSDRLRWITTEDYPAAALRANMQGVVVISATIGADGKVRSCLVTQSSGSQILDDATCRLYARRAHFTPARDADGNPTTAQRIDRYRWQIPNE